MRNAAAAVMLAIFIGSMTAGNLHSQADIDMETGFAFSGYNDVRIPGDAGTLFSLSQELDADDGMFLRLRLNYEIGQKHTLSLLYAPLTINSTGSFDQETTFMDTAFPAGEDIDAEYRFDSYRLTYRYEFHRSGSFEFGLGITGKIRDAEIRLKSGSLEESKKNTGFVPLINFRCIYWINDVYGLMLTGDALAAPQGRAEDVLAAVIYEPLEGFMMKFGYRVLEGGADNDEVYTFALIHYLIAGVQIDF